LGTRKVRIVTAVIVTVIFLLIPPMTAMGHFGMIIPSDDMIGRSEGPLISLGVMFIHPFENVWMDMEKPSKYGVSYKGGHQKDLRNTLQPVEIKGKKAWKCTFKTRRPGDYIFYVEPKPYWELTEEKFIVHYTKVVVNAFGMEEGWDEEVGLKTEIVPLTRPYGLGTNNVFQGIVKVNGKPVPYSEVEVEFYVEGAAIETPADPMITQAVKADQNGVFTYAMPKTGWWGFAALNEDDKTMKHDGKDYPVEIGAVLWVRTHDMK
jgi:cobalt/nickel transport protein